MTTGTTIMMGMLKQIKRAVLTTLLCVVFPVWASGQNTECGETVLLEKLIANPDTYQGKTVWVRAYVSIDFENMTACPPEKDSMIEHCLWLDIAGGSYDENQDYVRYESKLKIWQQRYNYQTVAIRATFDKTLKGHFSMWPGGLKDVTEVQGSEHGWSFSKNATVPRSSCVAAMQLPKEPGSHRWMRLGNLKLQDRDYDGAIADFSRAILLEPSNVGYYLIRGNTKNKKRDYFGAIADYTYAIENERDDKDVMYVIRAEVKEQAGDLDGAIADYTRAIEISPKFADAYRGRGLLRKKKGDSKGAASDMGQSAKFSPAQSLP